MMNSLRLSLGSLVLASVLAGCASGPDTRLSADLTPEQAVNQLLQNAATAEPARAAALRADAALRLLDMRQTERALRLLNDTQLQLLEPEKRVELIAIQVEYALENGNTEQALELLAKLPPLEQLNTQQAISASELTYRAQLEAGQPLKAVAALIRQETLTLSQSRRAQLHDAIWQALGDIPMEQLLRSVQSGSNSYYEQGWYELYIAMQQAPDLASQHQAHQRWQQLWQEHPALNPAPATLAKMLAATPIQAKRVAILLPESGPLAKPAALIREGLMSAYYAQLQAGVQVPEIIHLDASRIDTPEKLRDVIERQAPDLVIGPLNKAYVERLSHSAEISVPVLALNNSDNTEAAIYQLSLAIEDEARAAAERMISRGLKQVLVMTPATDWGDRMQAAFARHFTELGGTLVHSQSYGTDYAEQVSAMLGTDASRQRALNLRRMIGQNIEFEERRRQDADAIYLVARPDAARQIAPQLAFHFAGDLPVFASSQIYSGSISPRMDLDLNRIRFSDIPWVLDAPSQYKRTLSQLYDDAYTRAGRLYALGIDAFNVYPYLPQLAANPVARYQGETGTLHINQGKRLNRAFRWAVFRNGEPELLTDRENPQ